MLVVKPVKDNVLQGSSHKEVIGRRRDHNAVVKVWDAKDYAFDDNEEVGPVYV